MKPIPVLALVAAAAMILAAWALGQPASAEPADADKLADNVKPAECQKTLFAVDFENATTQDQYDPAAAGMGDLLAVLLAQQEGIRVVERHRLESLTAEQARSLRGLTGQKYAVAAGKLLKADTVITGTLYLVKGKLTVDAKAIDIATERVAAAGKLATRPEFLVQDALQLARDLAKQMSLPLPAVDPAKIDTMPIAGLHFGQALSSYYAGNLNAAIMGFMRTIDLNPDFDEALFWSGLCYSRLEEPEHAAIDLAEFLKRDPHSPLTETAKTLLADARAKEKNSTVERLTPADLMKGQPTTLPAPKKPDPDTPVSSLRQ